MSSSLNLGKLKEEQEKLKKRGGDGAKNWLQISKMTAPVDLRILDPLPSMDGVYYVEVPTWWVNGKRLISKKIFSDPNVVDIVEAMKEEAEAAAKKDASLAALLVAKNKYDVPMIQFKWDYWVPVLQFGWNFDGKSGAITGIKDEKGYFSTELIKKFIVDERIKIAVVNITILKAINTIATTRVNLEMLDQEIGSNIQITKTGEKRETKYGVVITEKMPMPKEFYLEGKMIDPFEIAQSLMYTDEYMEFVMGNYLYGDVQIPADADSNYEFPEIKAKLKDRFKEIDAEEEKLPTRQRPSGRFVPGAKEPAPAPAPAESAPVSTLTPAPAPDLAPVRAGRAPAAGRPVGRPTGRRNLLKDLQETQ